MARPTAEALKTLIKELRALEHGDTLADVSSRAILDRAARSGDRPDAEPGLGKKLADEAELDEAARKTSAGDPFEVLERGPNDASEASLLSALLAAGLARRLEEAEGAQERRALVSKLLDRLDWLEATTGLTPYRALSEALDKEQAEVFWTTAAEDLAEQASAKPLPDPTDAGRRRTRLLVRASALAEAPNRIRGHLATSVLPNLEASEIKRVALAALAGVDDTEAAASPSSPGGGATRAASAARAPKLEGELEGPPWGWVLRLLAAVTGVLLIRWLVHLVARYLLGYRRTGAMTLSASTVTVEHQVRLLGRTIREGTTSFALRSLRSGGLEERFRYLHLLVGALVLVISAALGVNFLVEGALSSYPPLAIFGIAVIGGGILLDVLLEVLVPNRKGVDSISLDFGRRKHLRLRGVRQELSAAFLKELEQLVPKPKQK